MTDYTPTPALKACPLVERLTKIARHVSGCLSNRFHVHLDDDQAKDLLEGLELAIEALSAVPLQDGSLVERLRRTEKRKNYLATNRTAPIIESEYDAPVNPDGPEAAAAIERVEQIVSAWAFAHNIDGAARNDLFARLRDRAAPAAVPQEDQVERAWGPHMDYAGEPMRPGEFRDPPEDQVERVARAIFDSHNATYTMGGLLVWESDPEHWRRYARAALRSSGIDEKGTT